MPLMINPNCPDCRKFWRTGDFFHSKEVWDKYHNSGWTNGISDWQSREEMKETLDRMFAVWLKERRSREKLRMEHGESFTPDWKVKKTMSKKNR